MMLFSLFALISFLALLILTIYVLYDVISKQDDMRGIEKILWIIVVLVFNIVGILAYLLIVKLAGIKILEERPVDELEKLAELREREAITEEEYQELKKELVEDIRERYRE